MANYATLKSDLDAVIKTNITRSITGDVLNHQLDGIIDALGLGYQYMGMATPATNPGSPDSNVVYLATTAGTYTGFGGLVLTSGKIAFFRYNGTWQKDEISVQSELTMDNTPTEGSDNPVKSGGIYDALAAKQDVILDLAAIREGAIAGDTAYQKPTDGIPASDLTAEVRASLAKADSAVQDISGKQDLLVSGTNIKTINGDSILGSGNLVVDTGTDIDTVTVSVDNNSGIPAATGTVVGSTLQLAFTNLKGAQGNSGYSGAAGELEVVNNLTDGGATKALSAEMGKDLDSEIKSLALTVKSNVMAIYDALANMAFTGARPTLNWGSLDVNVITNFSDPAGVTYTDNSTGGRVSFGSAYAGTLTANEGYTLSNVSVTMAGGGTITYNSGTGAISTNSVTGDITIAATATFDFSSLGYTSDGLVFALDGIHKGSVANAWTDLIGNQSFANHGATANANHWAFDGTDDYLGGWDETELAFNPASCTIEVAYKMNGTNQGNGFLCHLAKQVDDTINCIYYNEISNYINGVYVSGAYNVWGTSHQNTAVVAGMNAVRGYRNGTALSALGSGHWTGNRQGRYIGTTTDYMNASPTFNKGFFKGEIYAIRIYNRQLTEAEILADQAVDNNRFNLGITL